MASNNNNEITKKYDDVICKVCDKGDREDVLLICDGCEKGYHCDCIGIISVPEGNWVCPVCKREGVKASPAVETSQMEIVKEDLEINPVTVTIYKRVSTKGQDAP